MTAVRCAAPHHAATPQFSHLGVGGALLPGSEVGVAEVALRRFARRLDGVLLLGQQQLVLQVRVALQLRLLRVDAQPQLRRLPTRSKRDWSNLTHIAITVFCRDRSVGFNRGIFPTITVSIALKFVSLFPQRWNVNSRDTFFQLCTQRNASGLVAPPAARVCASRRRAGAAARAPVSPAAPWSGRDPPRPAPSAASSHWPTEQNLQMNLK